MRRASPCLAGILESLRQTGRVVRTPGLVRTLSETVSGELRDTMRERFGVEIQDSYSSQEFGLIALQCPVSGAYHALEQVMVEVVNEDGRSCAPGEVGRLLVTDLINFASPMIRYDIGDLAEAGAPCGCGRPIGRFGASSVASGT
jgi:phenylacetate-CoA ligase